MDLANKLYFRLIILFYSINCSVFSQNPDWMVYDTTNSIIPSNYVTSFAEDLTGNMWIGTYNGLVKISSSEWLVYNTSNSNLPSNKIETIAIDSNNTIWIGFNLDGLASFDGFNWEHYTSLNSSLPSDCITCITVDKINRIWVASRLGCGIGGVLVIEDNSWVTFTPDNSELPVGTVSYIDVDDSLNAWIGMHYLIADPGPILGGLAKFDGINWEFFDYDTPGFSQGDITCIEADNDTVWVGTDWGLSKFDGQMWTTLLEENSGLPNNYINSVFAESSGNKWIGLGRATFEREGALAKYVNESFTIFDTSNSPILPGYVTSVLVDSNRNKWLAIRPYWDQSTTTAYGGGLAIYNEDGVIVNITGHEDNNLSVFSLSTNYPNPFNPTTTIRYTIPNNGNIELVIFDLLGNEVSTLVKKYQSSGIYEVNFNASQLVSGVYIYTLQFGDAIYSKKMLYLK